MQGVHEVIRKMEKSQKNGLNRGLIGLFFIVLLSLLLTNFVSAEIMKFEQTPSSDTSDFIKNNYNPQYGIVKVDNSFLWFWDVGKKVEYSLIDNTDFCLNTCEASGAFSTYESTVLFEGVKFLDLRNGRETSIKDSKYYISTAQETKEVEVPDTYEKVYEDSPNAQGEYMFSEVPKTYKKINITQDVWVEYNGEEIQNNISGKWKIIGHKDRLQSVDFIPIAENNIELTPYATWNSSFEVGLEAVYNFNESSSNAFLTDIYKGQYNTTINGSVKNIPSVLGINNNARNFTGAGDSNNFQTYVPISTILPENWTISFWTNSSSCSNYGVYFSSCMGGTSCYHVQRANDNRLAMLRVGVSAWEYANGTIPCGRWSHIVITAQNKDIKMYINGTLAYAQTFANAPSKTTKLTIGGDNNQMQAQSSNSAMDEFYIWNRTLSLGEVGDLWNSGTGIFYTSNIPDSDYPKFLNNLISKTNNSEYNPSNTYEFNVTASSSNGTIFISLNGTNYSMSNNSISNFYKNVGNLGAGIYPYYFYGYGNGSNKNFNNSETFYYTIQKNSTKLNISGNSPITYGTNSSVNGSNCPSQITCSMDKPNLIYGVAVSPLLFNFSTSGNENYTANDTTYSLTINKATPSLSLVATTNISYGTVSDFVGSNCPDGTCSLLYLNNVYGATNNFTNKYMFNGNENYSAANATYSIIINKAVPTLGISRTSPVYYGNITDFTGTGCDPQISCSFNQTPLNQVYGAGTIYVNYSTVGNENYTGGSTTNFITIMKAIPALNLYINGQITNQTVYSGSINVTATTTGGILGLQRNGADFISNNGILVSYTPGYYLIMANVTGNENYTSVSNIYRDITFTRRNTWDLLYTYDNYVGGTLNSSLWENSSFVSGSTYTNLLKQNSGINITSYTTVGASSVSWIDLNTTNFIDYSKVLNMSFLVNMYTGADSTSQDNVASINVFGNIIKSIDETYQQYNKNNYTIVSNGSNFDVYASGTDNGKITSITPTNSKIELFTYSRNPQPFYSATGILGIEKIYYYYKPMNITLNSPANNTKILLNESLIFNSTEINYIATLKNVTLIIDGNDSESKSVSGYSSNTIFNKTIDVDGDHTYSIRACDNDGNCINTPNYAYNVPSYKINSYSYSPIIAETSSDYFTVNASIIEGTWSSIYADLIYNGIIYSTTKTGSGNNFLFTKYLDIPPVTSGNSQNNSFYWNISLISSNGTSYVSSPVLYQTVYKIPSIFIGLTCPADYYPSLYFDFKTEQNNTPINASVSYNLLYGINSTTVPIYGNISNIPSFSICINKTQSTYGIGYGQIQYLANGYNPRNFYLFNNSRISNVSINNSLYLLDTANAQYFTFTAKDNALNVYANNYLSLLRWYPNLNQYNVVEMGLTDTTGSAIMSTQLNSVDYRVGVYNKNGGLIYLLNTTKFACSVLPCTYPITINSANNDYTTIFGVQQNLSYNKNTRVFTFVWSDPSQTTSKMNLSVYQMTGLSEDLICQTSSTGFTGVLACNVSAYNGTFDAQVWRSASPPQPIAMIITSASNAVSGIADSIKLFFGFILTVLFIAIGLAIGIYGVLFGIVVSAVANFFLGTISWIVASSIIAIVFIIYLVLKRIG